MRNNEKIDEQMGDELTSYVMSDFVVSIFMTIISLAIGIVGHMIIRKIFGDDELSTTISAIFLMILGIILIVCILRLMLRRVSN